MRNIGVALAVLLLGVLAYLLASQWRVLFPDARDLEVPADCDLAQAGCEVSLPDGGSVSLAILPRPIPLIEPLTLQVEVRGSAMRPVHLDITGINMQMGLNRTPLVRVESGVWGGETLLPVCSQRKMHWQADLVLADGSGRYRLRSAFFTHR